MSARAKEYAYISCPYCGRSIVKERFKKARFPIDPAVYRIYSVREQKSEKGFSRGKGANHRGFFMVEGSGKTILDLMNGTEEQQKIAVQIADRIKIIYDSYRKEGLVE